MPGWFGRRVRPTPPVSEGAGEVPVTGRCGEGLGLDQLSDPLDVAAALAADTRGPAQWWVRDYHLGYTYDPDMRAYRDDDGGWVVEYAERGRTKPGPYLADDRAMVAWLLDEARGA